MGFKVGDTVKLTGPGWEDASDLDWLDLQVIESLNFEGNGVINGGWVVYDEEGHDWSGEKVFGGSLGPTPFEQSVRYHTNKIADLLIAKNKAYGDSALNPVRIFSKADRMEQLYIRLDDKLSRVQKGHEYPGDDTLQDIIGYCALILIARESN